MQEDRCNHGMSEHLASIAIGMFMISFAKKIRFISIKVYIDKFVMLVRILSYA